MRSGVIAQKVRDDAGLYGDRRQISLVTVLKLATARCWVTYQREERVTVALAVGSGTRKTVYLPKAEQRPVCRRQGRAEGGARSRFRVSEDALIPCRRRNSGDHFVVGQFVECHRHLGRQGVCGASSAGISAACAPLTVSR